MRSLKPSEFRLLVAVLIVACCCAMIISSRIHADARSRHSEAVALRAASMGDFARLRSLLNKDAVVDDRPRAEQDLLARIRDLLRAAGVDAGAVSDVRIDEPRAIQRSGRFTQSAEATITGLKPGELAEVVASWTNEEPLWSITSIRMDHEQSSARKPIGSATPQSYRAVIRFENVFVRAARQNGATE
ncbi:MAG: hypothetical protein RLN60_05775 [Phycisphaerales bacterium]